MVKGKKGTPKAAATAPTATPGGRAAADNPVDLDEAALMVSPRRSAAAVLASLGATSSSNSSKKSGTSSTSGGGGGGGGGGKDKRKREEEEEEEEEDYNSGEDTEGTHKHKKRQSEGTRVTPSYNRALRHLIYTCREWHDLGWIWCLSHSAHPSIPPPPPQKKTVDSDIDEEVLPRGPQSPQLAFANPDPIDPYQRLEFAKPRPKGVEMAFKDVVKEANRVINVWHG